MALAAAYGARAELVQHTEEFTPALQRAMAANRPALIELRTDPDILSPKLTLQQLRARSSS